MIAQLYNVTISKYKINKAECIPQLAAELSLSHLFFPDELNGMFTSSRLRLANRKRRERKPTNLFARCLGKLLVNFLLRH